MNKTSLSKFVGAAMPEKAAKPTKSTNPKVSNFADNLLYHPDAAVAAQLVGEKAALDCDIENKAEREAVQAKCDEVNTKLDMARVMLSDIEAKKRATPRFKKVRRKPSDEDDMPLSWSFYDRVNFAVLLLGMMVCLVVGAANAYAAMMGTGALVFVENPTLALVMSLIVPIGSLAIKQISSVFYYANDKLLYTKMVAGLTALLLLAWSVCFAAEYSAVDAAADFSFEEGEAAALNWLVWLQLLVELCAASTLGLGAEVIYHKYDPELEKESEAYLAIVLSHKKQQAQIDELVQIQSKYTAQITLFDAKREVAMNEAVAAYVAKRERFNAMQQF